MDDFWSVEVVVVTEMKENVLWFGLHAMMVHIVYEMRKWESVFLHARTINVLGYSLMKDSSVASSEGDVSSKRRETVNVQQKEFFDKCRTSIELI